jgi:type I restriction enzyme R subunit
MVMRPYQITATERILNRIEIANNYKKYGSVAGGGYIWHTTGAGGIIMTSQAKIA